MGTDPRANKENKEEKATWYAMGYNKDCVIGSDAKNRFRDL
jgi:hypothetical protein